MPVWHPGMLMKQPLCHVISHPGSTAINDCVRSLDRWSWSWKIWPAVDGRRVTAADWDRIGVTMSSGGKMHRRPGAQGCWMSHWGLWNHCVATDKPMVVLEHDAVVQAPWPEDLDIEPLLVKLYRSAPCKDKPLYGRWSKGSHAYSLTPAQAARLIDFARNNPAQAVDKHFGDRVISWTFYQQDLVVLSANRGPSSTSR